MKTKTHNAGSLTRLVRRLRRWGHEDEAEALKTVNVLMEEYATTTDRLTSEAERFADDLTELARAWSVSHRPVVHAGRRSPNRGSERQPPINL